jgi:lysyl-tRNA synthetase class 2
MNSTPYSFDRSRTAQSLHDEFDNKIEAGEHTDHEVSVAGRVMLRRGQGKVVFAALDDSSGRIQLFAPADVTPDFEDFKALSLGDWIGVKGVMVKTRKGELSIEVREWTMLAEARRQFPDKWHGLSDPDIRYRQRYVDLWVTPESRRTFLLRSQIVHLIRQWMHTEGFMEVETPILQDLATGALALPFQTHHNALDLEMYLRIAPELFLKRLTAGGFEKVYELGRLFRNEGISPRHNPEFTSLEWYEAYTDADGTMDRFERLTAYLVQELFGTTTIEYDGREIDFSTPWPRVTISEITSKTVGVDLDINDLDTMHRVAQEHLGKVDPSWGPGKQLLEIYEKTTEHTLWGPVFVTEYPKEVSPLARDHRSKPGLTERFECIVANRELANGFSELVDPDEQRARFEDQARAKEAGDAEAMVIDEDYLRAMEYGLPPTGGIGFGVDRLVMLLTDSQNIRDVVLFPTLRPEGPVQ